MGTWHSIQVNWDIVPPALAMALVAFLCYIAGRMQQWHLGTGERERSFAEGYNLATMSLFSLATRASKGQVQAPPLMESKPQPKMSRGVVKVGKHSVSTGEMSSLQQTNTYTAWDQYHNAA